MADKVKSIASTALQRWKAISKKTKIFLSSGLLALLIVVAVIAAVVANRPYTTLFTDLSESDMSAILTYFQDNGITQYKVEDDTLLVPESQEASLKAEVLVAGYPTSGYGYDTYLSNVGSLTTESERNQLTLYDLQDRMAAVIRNFEGVKDAVVFLTPGEDHTYVLDSGSTVDATAAVQVTMQSGQKLSDSQVKAIRNLVSRSMQGLNVENVEITDTYGNSYSASDDLSDLQDASSLKMALEEQSNNTIRSRVLQALIPLFGENNIQVSVNTVVNVDRVSTDSTDYSLEDWATGNDDGIIGSQIWDNEIVRDDGTTNGGTAGTSSNADLNTYVEEQTQPNGNENVISSSGQTDHLVDQTQQQTEHVAGYISDVMISVTINEDAVGTVDEDDLYSHVARAAGISQEDQNDKISILVAPFYEQYIQTNTTPSGLQSWMLYVAIGGVVLILLLILLVLLLARRRRAKKLLEQGERAVVAAPAPVAAPPVAEPADIMEMQTEKSMELRQDVRNFAKDNPEIAAQMVKNWLRESE